MSTDYTQGYQPAPDETDQPPRQRVIGGLFTNRPGTQTSGSLAGGGTYANSFTHPYRSGAINRILGNQLNSGGLADLQMALVQVGLLDSDEVVFGYADDTTTSAMRTILGLANQQGMPWQDVLSQALQMGDNSLAGAAGNGGANPDDIRPQIVLPNRDELRTDIDEATFARAGVRYDPAVLDRITEQAMDHARDLQLQEFNQRHAGERQEGRSLESFVSNAIEEADPAAAMEHDVDEKAASWFDAIRSPV